MLLINITVVFCVHYDVQMLTAVSITAVVENLFLCVKLLFVFIIRIRIILI